MAVRENELGSVHLRMRGPLLQRIVSHPFLKTLFPFAVVVAIWWAIAELEVFPPAFFVGPGEVAVKFVDLVRKGILPDYLGESVVRLLVGAVFALGVGIPLGYLIGLNKYVRKACWPLLLFFQAISDIAWLPLLIIWFGFSLMTVNFVLFYCIVFPLIVGIVAGIDGIPQDMVRAARSLGANRRQVLFEVILPGSFASVATGIRTGLGYGWRGLIAAEIIVGTNGLGFMMFDARRAGEINDVFIGMIVLGVLWYITDTFILAPLEHETVERWGLVRRAGSNI